MDKYLLHYAEPEIRALDGLAQLRRGLEPWSNVLVIPACNESPGLLRPPPPCDGRCLLILVVNQPDDAPGHVESKNRELAVAVQAQFSKEWESAPKNSPFALQLFQDPSAERDVLLVDRFSPGRQLPRKGGVGLARKIGADLAARLIQRGQVGAKWIHCTDADVYLPDTYFSCLKTRVGNGAEYSALTYPFRHCGLKHSSKTDGVLRATWLYELSLHYYVAGLKWAGSPYAFHTIGSTMAINAFHYAKVRGFPRREAGEDFYLLNKLAKVGPVRELEADDGCDPIQITARLSERVPFGTGAAVNAMMQLQDPLEDYRFYDPAVFDLIRQWLQGWPGLWRSRLTALNHFPAKLAAGLNAIGTDAALRHAFAHGKDEQQFTRHMHTWFDAFRTLKLVHFLRGEYFPSLRLAELRDQTLFRELLSREPGLRVSHQQLIQDFRQDLSPGA